MEKADPQHRSDLMKIYRMIDGGRLGENLSFEMRNFPECDDIANAMRGDKQLLSTWTPPPVSLFSISGKKKTNFVRTTWSYAGFAVDARAAEVLQPYLTDVCELLPIKYGRQSYWILYIHKTADCLDLESTVFHSLERTPRDVLIAAFDCERLPKQQIFRVTRGFDYYVTDELKDVIERAKLSGVRFQFMWSDDGSEPDDEIPERLRKKKPSRRRKSRLHTKRDSLLERLWHDVILHRGDESALEDALKISRLMQGANDYDSCRAVRKLLKLGVSREIILDLMCSLAYEIVFDVLVAIEEECLDTSPDLQSLHEDLLIAEPS